MSRIFANVALLLSLSLLSAQTNPSELLNVVKSVVSAPEHLQEHLQSSQVIRHRFVTVDIEYLWNLFESARDLSNLDNVDPIRIGLFGDFSVEMRLVKVNHRYWSSSATLVTTMPGYGTDPDSNIFATMTLKRDESVSARIWAAGDIYYISPVETGPIHVVTQVDPEKMPSLD